MKKRGIDAPLLIGGATTSRQHTAVRIATECDHPVIHVKDASRVAEVSGSIIDPSKAGGFIERNREMQSSLQKRNEEISRKKIMPLSEVRSKSLSFDWNGVDIPDAPFIGSRTIEEIPLTELVDFIDWTFFFTSWDIPRRFPSVLEDEKYGEAARALFKDAESMLGEILENDLLTARAKYGFWKANSEGDDIVVFDEKGEAVVQRLNMLRQQQDRGGSDYACLSDFIAPMDSGREDHIGMFAVTAGIGAEELSNRFQEEGDDYSAIMANLLADRLAEAAAEWLHKKIRGEWGFPDPRDLPMRDILNEKYRSIRPAYGYPACPDHSEMRKTFQLLNAKEIGMRISENNAIIPAAGVSGLYFAHPESRYFSVGRMARDQIADYSERKGISIQDGESLLFANLGYFEKD